MSRCIIAGSRDITDKELVWGAISRSGFMYEITEVVCGGAEGVDDLGDQFAAFCRVPVVYFLVAPYNRFEALRNRLPDDSNIHVVANWNEHGKGAGHIRNKHMAVHSALGEGEASLIAVRRNHSSGTTSMIALAEVYGLRTYVEDVE